MRLTRENKLHSLEETIYKMTGKIAQQFQLSQRGTLEEGNYADLTIFNFDEIKENPQGDKHPDGINHVFINGHHVYHQKKFNKELLANSGKGIKVK